MQDLAMTERTMCSMHMQVAASQLEKECALELVEQNNYENETT